MAVLRQFKPRLSGLMRDAEEGASCLGNALIKESQAGDPAPHAGIKKPPLQGEQPIPPKRAPTLAETASRVREQEVFSCDFLMF